MEFEWRFNDHIFYETMSVDDTIDDDYYGTGELICDVFLITEMQSMHQKDRYPEESSKMINKLYYSNKFTIYVILKFKKEINEIQKKLNEIKSLNNERDNKLETYLTDYIDRTNRIISDRFSAIDNNESVANLKNYLNSNKKYNKLSSHIDKLEENLYNYVTTNDSKLAMKLSKTLLNQVNKIPEIMGQFYLKIQQLYYYLSKNRNNFGHIDLDIYAIHKFDYFLNTLQDAAYNLVDKIKSTIEKLQSTSCSKRIYSESYFQSSIDTLKMYINKSELENLKDYKDDGNRCFSLMEVYFKNGKNQLIFTLSGVWDSENADIENFFRNSGHNSNLIKACYELKEVLNNAAWAVTTKNVQNFMINIHGDMQSIGTLGKKMSHYPKGFIEDKKELKKVAHDFSCCERKIVSYMDDNYVSSITKCNLYVKFQPCEKCYHALNEFKKRNRINKNDFYLIHARTDELD